MKIFISLVTVLMFTVTTSFAQFALRAFNYRPTGDFGFAMKPQNSLEISYQDAFSKRPTKRWRGNMSLLYLKMKPRLEVFPIAGFAHDGNGDRVIAGLQSFSKYNILQFIIGYDYAIIHKNQFNFYAGVDLVGGGAAVEYELDYPDWKSESYKGGGVLAGSRFRVGIDYRFENGIGTFLTFNRHFALLTEPTAFLWANDYGIGISYLIN